jgi:hypothetical protein
MGCICPDSRSQADVDASVHSPECHAQWCQGCGRRPGRVNRTPQVFHVELVRHPQQIIEVVSDGERLGMASLVPGSNGRRWAWDRRPNLPEAWIARLATVLDHYVAEHLTEPWGAR